MKPVYPDGDQFYVVDEPLDLWLKKRKITDFPRAQNYGLRYESILEWLKNNVYKDVEKGALYTSVREIITQGDSDVEAIQYLNDHGIDHVGAVIQRASELLIKSYAQLTAFEGYLLLCSILFHDVGNLFGRKNHEANAWKVMQDMGALVGEDSAEKRTIIKIALVHGGSYAGSKDTIRNLTDLNELWGKPVRERYLAAVLRFSDELADDSSRASRYAPEGGSHIFHLYSKALHAVSIRENEIRLHYEVEETLTQSKHKKGKQKVFLLDEIYARTLKMHRERMYCMRFMRPFISIQKIGITVIINEEIVLSADSKTTFLKPETIKYTLEESGYPGCPDRHFSASCAGSHEIPTGSVIKKIFKQKRGERHV